MKHGNMETEAHFKHGNRGKFQAVEYI